MPEAVTDLPGFQQDMCKEILQRHLKICIAHDHSLVFRRRTMRPPFKSPARTPAERSSRIAARIVRFLGIGLCLHAVEFGEQVAKRFRQQAQIMHRGVVRRECTEMRRAESFGIITDLQTKQIAQPLQFPPAMSVHAVGPPQSRGQPHAPALRAHAAQETRPMDELLIFSRDELLRGSHHSFAVLAI
ncbi:hypothetical protein D6850_11085 [Roseovarius spongiae]|uniref:Uncharacterized protein n=1 Tax=Roseovarius spongiae TaxID=2320272 RepID=A0A3A8BA68_9RHOB|nr:hypothetical protein D6850_11085 [Roseovarius spongiae]